MKLLDIIFLALGVSLDSLAICVCKGIDAKKPFILAVKCAVCFAIFQAIMPFAGFYLGKTFAPFIDKFDHYIVFGVLLIFGLNMFKEAFSKEEKSQKNSFFSIFILAFVSSIDSFGMGLSLALFGANIFISAILICSLTLIFSFIGIFIGKFFGRKHKKISCIIGGIILMALAVKILINHSMY